MASAGLRGRLLAPPPRESIAALRQRPVQSPVSLPPTVMNNVAPLRSPPLPHLGACIVRSLKPFIAHTSGSLVLGCALYTLYSAYFDVGVTPSSQLDVAAQIAAFCTKIWLVQLVIDSADWQAPLSDWPLTRATTSPIFTDAALAVCSHVLALRLGAHHHLCTVSGCPTAAEILYALAVYLAVGACMLFGRTGIQLHAPAA